MAGTSCSAVEVFLRLRVMIGSSSCSGAATWARRQAKRAGRPSSCDASETADGVTNPDSAEGFSRRRQSVSEPVSMVLNSTLFVESFCVKTLMGNGAWKKARRKGIVMVRVSEGRERRKRCVGRGSATGDGRLMVVMAT
jgi:hypothetical protein